MYLFGPISEYDVGLIKGVNWEWVTLHYLPDRESLVV